MQPFNEELKILVDTLRQIGIKGEVKVAEWIRGSSVVWTNAYNKKSLSYGNHFGHTLEQWRLFTHQCHVLGLVKYELRSMIKGNGHYSVIGVYYPLSQSEQYIQGEKSLLLLAMKHCVNDSSVATIISVHGSSRIISDQTVSTKKIRLGKGSNILPVARKLLTDQENLKKYPINVITISLVHFLSLLIIVSNSCTTFLTVLCYSKLLLPIIIIFGMTFNCLRET